jgi:hypothetical protein
MRDVGQDEETIAAGRRLWLEYLQVKTFDARTAGRSPMEIMSALERLGVKFGMRLVEYPRGRVKDIVTVDGEDVNPMVLNILRFRIERECRFLPGKGLLRDVVGYCGR